MASKGTLGSMSLTMDMASVEDMHRTGLSFSGVVWALISKVYFRKLRALKLRGWHMLPISQSILRRPRKHARCFDDGRLHVNGEKLAPRSLRIGCLCESSFSEVVPAHRGLLAHTISWNKRIQCFSGGPQPLEPGDAGSIHGCDPALRQMERKTGSNCQ
jgi:hypothetical protein